MLKANLKKKMPIINSIITQYYHKPMNKTSNYILGLIASILLLGTPTLAATLPGNQGGTGIASTTAGNVGKVLTVASTSPFLTYTFSAGSGGGAVTINGITSSTYTFQGLQGFTFGTGASGTITLDSPQNLQITADVTFGSGVFGNLNATADFTLGAGSGTGADGIQIDRSLVAGGPYVVFFPNNAGTFALSGGSQDVIFGVITGNQFISSSGTINLFTFTNATGTTLRLTGQASLSSVSSTGLQSTGLTTLATTTVSTTLTVSGQTNLQSASATNITATGYITGAALNISGVVSSSQLRVTSSTFTGINFTNATGTSLNISNVSGSNISYSGYLLGGTASFSTVSSTNTYHNGYLFVTGQTNLASVSSTNAQTTGYLRVGTDSLLAGVSSTNLTATSYVTVQGNTSLATTTVSTTLTISGITSSTELRAPSATVATSLTIPKNQNLTVSGQVGISVTTGTLNFRNGSFTALSPSSTKEFIIENPTASEDDAFWIAPWAGRVLEVNAVNKLQGDTVTFNIRWGTSRASTTAQGAQSAFTSDQAVTATTTPAFVSVNGSSTFKYRDVFRLVTSAASSSQFLSSIIVQPLP